MPMYNTAKVPISWYRFYKLELESMDNRLGL